MGAGRPFIHYIPVGRKNRQGIPSSNGFPQQQKIRDDSEMLKSEHPACPSHAGLDFIKYEKKSVFPANATQRLYIFSRRNHVPAFAHNRLKDNGPDIFRWNDVFKIIQKVLQAIDGTVFRSLMKRAAKTVRIRSKIDLWNKRRVMLPELRIGSGHRSRSHGPAVESAPECNDGMIAADIPGQLDSGLHHFGPGIRKKEFIQT